MNDSEFNALADATLARIEAGLEASDADVDFGMASAGVLEIEFSDGGKIIVNRHGAAREIWVAAKSGGFHYRWDGAVWLNTRDGSELMAALSKLVSAQAGQLVQLSSEPG
jgi:CyaY protein